MLLTLGIIALIIIKIACIIGILVCLGKKRMDKQKEESGYSGPLYGVYGEFGSGKTHCTTHSHKRSPKKRK